MATQIQKGWDRAAGYTDPVQFKSGNPSAPPTWPATARPTTWSWKRPAIRPGALSTPRPHSKPAAPPDHDLTARGRKPCLRITLTPPAQTSWRCWTVGSRPAGPRTSTGAGVNNTVRRTAAALGVVARGSPLAVAFPKRLGADAPRGWRRNPTSPWQAVARVPPDAKISTYLTRDAGEYTGGRSNTSTTQRSRYSSAPSWRSALRRHSSSSSGHQRC